MTDQEIYWAQGAGQTWSQLEYNNNYYFQMLATIKRRNHIWRIKDDWMRLVSGIGTLRYCINENKRLPKKVYSG